MSRSFPPAGRWLLEAAACLAVCLVARLWFEVFTGNEADVLPFARQAFDKSWLPHDWYLNLEVPYRNLFNQPVGFLLAALGFPVGTAAAWLLVHLLLAAAFTALFRALRLPALVGLVALALFARDQSLVAHEFILGAVDTKAVAYGFVILALAALATGRWRAAAAALGGALSFHILVGVYALYAAGVAVLVAGRPLLRAPRQLGQAVLLLALCGLPGWLAVADRLAELGGGGTEGWRIYVEYRVPYRLLPGHFEGVAWLFFAGAATLLFLQVLRRARGRRARIAAAYGLGAASLIGIGYLIDWFGDPLWMRFYWFRFPDVIVPLLGWVMLAWGVDRLARRRLAEAGPRLRRADRYVWAGGLAAALAVPGTPALDLEEVKLARPMLSWIRENTPRDRVFLASPTLYTFYMEAERSMFVSFVHAPQTAADLTTWHGRLKRATGGGTPRLTGFQSFTGLRRRFYNLDVRQILHLGREYGLDYYLGWHDNERPLPVVHRTRWYTLYRIPTGGRPGADRPPGPGWGRRDAD